MGINKIKMSLKLKALKVKYYSHDPDFSLKFLRRYVKI